MHNRVEYLVVIKPENEQVLLKLDFRLKLADEFFECVKRVYLKVLRQEWFESVHAKLVVLFEHLCLLNLVAVVVRIWER